MALFSFVKANERVSQPQEWTVAQFEEIQLHAMSALCTLGPLMIEDYMTCQGSTRSLLLLEWCVGPGTFNTSVVATTGRIHVIRFCVKCSIGSTVFMIFILHNGELDCPSF